MSIVIDINVLQMVFDPSNVNHPTFAPVKTWIEKGDGFLVFGGTKYLNELKMMNRSAKLVRLMRDAGKAVEIITETVDAIESFIQGKTTGTTCDDQHIMALLAAAHCALLCSQDKRSFMFIKKRAYYPKGTPKIRIYTSKRNSDLLRPCARKDIRNMAT